MFWDLWLLSKGKDNPYHKLGYFFLNEKDFRDSEWYTSPRGA